MGEADPVHASAGPVETRLGDGLHAIDFAPTGMRHQHRTRRAVKAKPTMCDRMNALGSAAAISAKRKVKRHLGRWYPRT